MVVGRLAVFVAERFSPRVTVPLVCVLVAAGYVPSVAARGGAGDPLRFAAAALVVGMVLLHLRMVDELKDDEVDRLGRPWRPLARGLVTRRELVGAAAVALALGAAIAATLGLGALAGLAPALALVLLADREFLVPGRIHRDLVVYALVHSPLIPLLLVFAWCAGPASAADPRLAGLMVLAWGVGLGLEVARKTYGPGEERPFVETYSAAIGRERALRLAAISLAVGVAGGAVYAWCSGGRLLAVGAALALGALCACGPWLLRDAGRRGTERAGTVAGLAILLWPIAVAGLGGGGW